jgi:hypothetical protein
MKHGCVSSATSPKRREFQRQGARPRDPLRLRRKRWKRRSRSFEVGGNFGDGNILVLDALGVGL